MGQALRTRVTNHMNEKYDMKALRSSSHYFILLGVSIYVFMDMEKGMTAFKSQINSSMSEREYDQQQSYKQIMEQLKEYDGEGVPMDRTEPELPTYRYELEDN